MKVTVVPRAVPYPVQLSSTDQPVWMNTSGVPRVFEAPFIQVESTGGELAIRLHDDELEVLNVVGYARGWWITFEVHGPPEPRMVKMIEERQSSADRNTGMHL